jgi:hypothetical protein
MRTIAIALLAIATAAAQDAKRVAENEALPHPAPRCVAPDCVILKPGESFKLPEAPSSSLHNDEEAYVPQPGERLISTEPLPISKPGFWDFGSWDAEKPLRTNYEVFHDKAFWGSEAFWLGTIIYDVEATHQGIAHHKCVEGNDDGNYYPSRAQLYRKSLPEFTVGTAFGLAMLKYVTKVSIFEFPAYSGTGHIRGGSSWFLNCW